MSKEDKEEIEQKTSEFMLDIDKLEPQKHIWTDRGLKFTCENAGHPYHDAWKVSKPMTS